MGSFCLVGELIKGIQQILLRQGRTSQAYKQPVHLSGNRQPDFLYKVLIRPPYCSSALPHGNIPGYHRGLRKSADDQTGNCQQINVAVCPSRLIPPYVDTPLRLFHPVHPFKTVQQNLLSPIFPLPPCPLVRHVCMNILRQHKLPCPLSRPQISYRKPAMALPVQKQRAVFALSGEKIPEPVAPRFYSIHKIIGFHQLQ